MGLYDETVEVPRRTMVLFFIVDTSGSMSGSKIGTVNSAIEEIIPEISDISDSNADAQIKIAALQFSTGAKWLDSQPVSAENFVWNYLDASGVTDLGEACMQLNEKLSRTAFMSDATGSFAPAIFLMSDGEPTDNYRYGLDKLKQNNWFKKAIRVAIAIGDDANKNVLTEFAGNPEAVIDVTSPKELRKWIQFVTVRASEIGSRSSNAGAGHNSGGIETKQDIMIQEIQSQKDDDIEWNTESPFDDDDSLQW
ncbi:MAG: VWA domain-containing protein [Ruminococcus sp.]|nr:VWA domain-containing protein [Ruminococcus sp.]MDE6101468.1 VWA domain-containing protein [Ruminococcus sp.]